MFSDDDFHAVMDWDMFYPFATHGPPLNIPADANNSPKLCGLAIPPEEPFDLEEPLDSPPDFTEVDKVIDAFSTAEIKALRTDSLSDDHEGGSNPGTGDGAYGAFLEERLSETRKSSSVSTLVFLCRCVLIARQ
jgi:hypothetical protein